MFIVTKVSFLIATAYLFIYYFLKMGRVCIWVWFLFLLYWISIEVVKYAGVMFHGIATFYWIKRRSNILSTCLSIVTETCTFLLLLTRWIMCCCNVKGECMPVEGSMRKKLVLLLPVMVSKEKRNFIGSLFNFSASVFGIFFSAPKEIQVRC